MVGVRSNRSKKFCAADSDSPIRRALKQRQCKQIAGSKTTQPTVIQRFSLIVLQILQKK